MNDDRSIVILECAFEDERRTQRGYVILSPANAAAIIRDLKDLQAQVEDLRTGIERLETEL